MPYTCPTCSEDFPTAPVLLQHLETSSTHTVACSKCEQTFKDLTDLDLHLASSAHPPTECKQCRRSFVDEAALKEHLQNSAKHKQLQEEEKGLPQGKKCLECGRKFRDVGALRQHWSAVHADEERAPVAAAAEAEAEASTTTTTTIPTHKCKYCASRFTVRSALHDHEHSSNNGEVCSMLKVPCVDCGRAFRTNDALDNHRQSTGHNMVGWACRECDETMVNEQERKWHVLRSGHMARHLTLQCSFASCGRVFASEGAIARHYRAVHGFMHHQDLSVEGGVYDEETEKVAIKPALRKPRPEAREGEDQLSPLASPRMAPSTSSSVSRESSRSASCGREMSRRRTKHVTWARHVDVRVC